MKIGIITFHWGTNYGGVIQAFALQEFLRKMGASVFVINFAPRSFRDSILRCFFTKRPKMVFQNLINYVKDLKINQFRKEYLTITSRYYSLDDLIKDPPKMDVYLCGSDQVWNPYSIDSHGKAYFLPFGNSSVKRISYAASLGCTIYPDEAIKIITPLLKKFQAISVRENSGVEILNEAGFSNVKVLPDPTLLLRKIDYERLISNYLILSNNYVFFYILQSEQKLILDVYKYVKIDMKMVTVNSTKIRSSMMSMQRWLCNFRDSKHIITNSFHGVVFSIIFCKPFIVIPVEGRHAGMNDRIFTLLKKYNLEERILDKYDGGRISKIMNTKIHWSRIDEITLGLQSEAFEYLKESIFPEIYSSN